MSLLCDEVIDYDTTFFGRLPCDGLGDDGPVEHFVWELFSSDESVLMTMAAEQAEIAELAEEKELAKLAEETELAKRARCDAEKRESAKRARRDEIVVEGLTVIPCTPGFKVVVGPGDTVMSKKIAAATDGIREYAKTRGFLMIL